MPIAVDYLHRLRRAAGLPRRPSLTGAGFTAYLGSVEREERNVAIDNICRIAWALGVQPRDLLSVPPGRSVSQ
jgi:hypothetical protein